MWSLQGWLFPSISLIGTAFLALRSQSFSGLVGSSTPDSGTSPSNYGVTILWGDGSSSAGTISGSYNVSGTHLYLEAGSFPVAVPLPEMSATLAA